MGVGYDYNSIMHYNDNFFARQPGLRTMVAVAGDEIVLGHALQLSPLDIIQANNFYQCGMYLTNTIIVLLYDHFRIALCRHQEPWSTIGSRGD